MPTPSGSPIGSLVDRSSRDRYARTARWSQEFDDLRRLIEDAIPDQVLIGPALERPPTQ